MPIQLSSIDWKSIFEAVHAASTLLIPIGGAIVFIFREKFRGFIREEVATALKQELHAEVKSTVRDTVEMMFSEMDGTVKRIAKDANDELLVKINGTYVRSREQVIRDENFKDRLNRIDDSLNMLRSHFS